MLLVVGLAPTIDAEHCSSRIEAFGRTPNAPALVPPPSPAGRVCLAVETTLPTEHFLLPYSELLYVRVDADLGTNYPRLPLTLDGLGFREQHFQLERTTGLTGKHSYELGEWITMPDAPHASGHLFATVRFPGNHVETARYELLPAPSTVSDLRLS